MPDYSRTYSTLVIQPVDLINAFKLDFCFASVIKWFTKLHLDDKSENLMKTRYYTNLCHNTPNPLGLKFAIRMYCVANGFIKEGSSSCLMFDVVNLILDGKIDEALRLQNIL